MNIAVTPIRRLRHTIASFIERSRRAPERAEDRWARIAAISRTIDHDVDLNDEDDLVRALFAARWCANDFDDCLDEIVDEAKRQRAAAEAAF